LIPRRRERPSGCGGRAGYPPQLEQEFALSSQRRVSSSVQPGTAKRAPGEAALGLGSTIALWAARRCGFDALGRCTRGGIRRRKQRDHQAQREKRGKNRAHRNCSNQMIDVKRPSFRVARTHNMRRKLGQRVDRPVCPARSLQRAGSGKKPPRLFDHVVRPAISQA